MEGTGAARAWWWWVAVAAAGLAVGLPFVAATGFPGYSHRSQYISELGAQGAPDGALVSAGFVLVGLLLLASTAGAVRVLAVAAPLTLAGAVAVGLVGGGLGGSYAITGVARCDAGCPEVGDVSTAQQVHNLVGSLGYVLAIGGVILFGVAARRVPRWGPLAGAGLALAPVLVVVAGLVTVLDDWRGLLQRGLEVLLLAWLLAVVARLPHGEP